jgi:hypothetical protein
MEEETEKPNFKNCLLFPYKRNCLREEVGRRKSSILIL